MAVVKSRWNPFTDSPIKNAGEYCQVLRRIVNGDKSKLEGLGTIIEKAPKVIIFYNYNYERDALREYFDDLGYPYAEWNGEKHEPIPDTDEWAYIVQYTAGAEGWNCIKTDTIIFFSENYSYKIMVQSAGRIDRMNTSYEKLYYYHFKTKSPIDMAVSMALRKKKKFNENDFTGGMTW